MTTAILTNGSPEMIDAIISVEEVGVYKPHPSVYQRAVDRLGVSKEHIAFQSSNAWDAVAAAHFGFRVVWCNRNGQKPERLPAQPDLEVRSLAELPAIVGAVPTRAVGVSRDGSLPTAL
jgi:2-haloacid dehalogenase